jgi:DNA-binding CsgD family transcriptional regulator
MNQVTSEAASGSEGRKKRLRIVEVTDTPDAARQANLGPRLPIARPICLGRDIPIQALFDLAAQTRRSSVPRLAVVEGEPGIGKTTLLEAFAADLHDTGMSIVRIHHDSLTMLVPLAGFAAAFPNAVPTHPHRELPSLVNSSPALDSAFNGFTGVIENLAVEGPAVLLVDDLHVADRATLSLLAVLPDRIVGLPLLIVLTHRSTDARSEAAALCDHYERRGAQRIVLDPLSVHDARQVVAAFAPGGVIAVEPVDESQVESFIDQAGGNPFVLSLLARDLGNLSPSPGLGDVGATVRSRLLPKDPELARIVDFAAILGEAFRVADLAALAGVRLPAVVALLPPLISAGIFVERTDGLAFRHHLVHAAVYQNIPAYLRTALHREAAEVFATSGRPAVAVARHLRLIEGPLDSESRRWFRAAAREIAAHDPDESLKLLDEARRGAGADELAEIDAARLFALLWANRFEEAIVTGRRSIAATTDPTSRLKLSTAMAAGMMADGRAAEATALLADVVEHGAEPAVSALACAVASLTAVLANDLVSAETHSARAMSLADGAAGPAARAGALIATSRVAAARLDFAAARGAAEDAAAHAQSDTTGLAAGFATPLFACLAAADDEDAEAFERWLTIGRVGSERPGEVWTAPAFHGVRAEQLRQLGRLSDSLAEAETGMSIARQTRSPFGAALCAAVTIDIATRTGDIGRAESTVGEANNWDTPAFATLLGTDLLTVAKWNLELANPGIVGTHTDLVTAWTAAEDTGRFGTARCLAVPLTAALLRAGDFDALGRLALSVRRWTTTTAFSRSVSVRSMVGLITGLSDRDIDAVQSSLALLRDGQKPLQLGDSIVAALPFLLELGGVAVASAALREARSVFDELGCTGSSLRLRSAAQELGVSAPRGRPRRASLTGWASLSHSELAVARLVAQLATNREVAEELFISPRTVETHLRNTFNKLSIESRRELVRQYQNHESK